MKKRILSLILALSMVLSVLPLGAFAEGSNQGLTIGSDGYPTASNGNGWSYDNNTKTLTLTEGTFDFSSTAPVQCAIKLGQSAAIAGGTFNGAVTNDNHGNINNGTFKGTVINANGGLIFDGTFKGDVTNYATTTNDAPATIINGTFEGTVTNDTGGIISGGTFSSTVENDNLISGGTFQKMSGVKNEGTIDKGTFEGIVMNGGTKAIIPKPS